MIHTKSKEGYKNIVKYSKINNIVYMFKMAWNIRKSVIILCFISAFLSISLNLLHLFIAPVILRDVEKHVSLKELLFTIGVFVILLLIIDSLFTYVNANTIFGRIELRTYLTFKIHDKLSVTSYPNIKEQKFLKMLDRASNAVSGNSGAAAAIWDTYTELIQNIVGFIIYFWMLSSLNFWVVLITLVTSVVGYLVNNYINGWGFRHREEEAEYSRKLGYITSKVQDHSIAKDIRIFAMREWLENVYTSTLNLYKSFISHREIVYVWTNVVDALLALIQNGFAYVYIIILALSRGWTASEFLLYFSAVGGFNVWVSGIFSQFSKLHIQSFDISCIREYLDAKEQFNFENGEMINLDSKSGYEIELKNVSFCYPGSSNAVLKHINLKIHFGEKIAVVGLNGAGKTTLVKLICGFLDPTEGEVLLNNRDIREFNRFEYYKLFSAVFQEFSVLAATISCNVAQSLHDIDMERVKSCLSKAGLSDKIENMPDKYDTHLCKEVFDDAVELSGGELQHLMLARALYKDAPIIVLDEPTAALDPIAESDIYSKYNELTTRRTSIYISHRLASTRFCDRVLFIENGTICEQGTHDELMNKHGKYFNMFSIQSQYYQDRGGVCEDK